MTNVLFTVACLTFTVWCGRNVWRDIRTTRDTRLARRLDFGSTKWARRDETKGRR